MRSLRSSVALAIIVAVIPAAGLRAQVADSAAFHRGQWGMDFNAGYGFAGAGLIRFRSPTRALVLSVGGSLQTTSYDPASGYPGGNRTEVNVNLGARRYHLFAPRLYYYRTVGVEGAYTHQFSGGDAGSTEIQWNGGLFGEVGLGWLVTPHLALGAAWRLNADYYRADQRAGAQRTWTSGFTATLAQPRLTGQLYF